MPLLDLGSTRCRPEGYFLSPGATAGTSVRICARAATRRDDVVAVLAATVEDDSSDADGRASRVRDVGDGVVALPAATAHPL